MGIIFNTRVVLGRAKATIEMYIVARVLILIPEVLRGVLKLQLECVSMRRRVPVRSRVADLL